MWDLEPDSDYIEPSDKIKYVNDNVKNGSIILLHPMYDRSGKELEALEGILELLTKKGYTFVTVNELQNEQ